MHTLPLVAQLKKSYPHCHITWVVQEEFADVLSLCREIDEVITIPLKAWTRQWIMPKVWVATLKNFWSLKKKLNALTLDVTLDPQGLLKSGIVVGFLGAPNRIGFARDNSREFNFLFNNVKVPSKKEVNIIRKNYLLIEALFTSVSHNTTIDAKSDFSQIASPHFDIPIKAKKKIRDFLIPLKLKKTVLVNPWSAVKLKELPFERFKTLCENLYQRNKSKPILMFGPQDKKKAESWSLSCPVHLATPTTLIEAVALISQCDYYIGCDTGPTYISAFLNKPTTALFGPTNAERQMPYLNNVKVRYSIYDCPTVKPEPITTPYRCAVKCPNNLCMQKFEFDYDL